MKRCIVFDSSTLILLAKISLLRNVTQKAKCITTDIIEKECTKKDTYDSNIIRELIKENMIRTAGAKREKLGKLLEDFNIQEGEASALALAIKENCILATDDKPTMKACVILNIRFTTAVHFLVLAFRGGMIEREDAMEKLYALEKYGRYATRIIEDAKRRMGG